MELILMRHAETESGASYEEDSLRPLTANGKSIQRLVAQNMHQLNIRPDVILCSPRLRAQQTAEITLGQFDVDPVIETVQILDGGYAVDQLINLLIEKVSKYSPRSTILCVGHVPDMGIWMDSFLGADADPANKFKTSSFAHLVFEGEPEPGNAKLKGFYRADALRQ